MCSIPPPRLRCIKRLKMRIMRDLFFFNQLKTKDKVQIKFYVLILLSKRNDGRIINSGDGAAVIQVYSTRIL